MHSPTFDDFWPLVATMNIRCHHPADHSFITAPIHSHVRWWHRFSALTARCIWQPEVGDRPHCGNKALFLAREVPNACNPPTPNREMTAGCSRAPGGGKDPIELFHYPTPKRIWALGYSAHPRAIAIKSVRLHTKSCKRSLAREESVNCKRKRALLFGKIGLGMRKSLAGGHEVEQPLLLLWLLARQ